MILIRADANEMIGTGHVMRCLSLARAFSEEGIEVLFITADHRGDRLIQSAGFCSICMESEWTNMEEEIAVVREIIDQKKADFLLVDSYYVTESYFHELKQNIKIIYIDDLNEGFWDVDYLINYNIYAKTFNYDAYTQKVCLMLGPSYAPLRAEFRNCPKHIIKDEITDVLISAGGADPECITERILQNICFQWPNITFHFIVGALNPRLENIRFISKDIENTVLHINEKHMAELMKKCDVAISAAGSTLYELCACGIPTITYILADNQITAADEFEKQRIMLSAGDCRKNLAFIEKLEECLRLLLDNKEVRGALSVKMQRSVDGKGAIRIVNALD